MATKNAGTAMCLKHFLEHLESLPQPVITEKKDNTATTNIHEPTAQPTPPTRRQPSRKAKKPTNFYAIENPGLLKRMRDNDDEKTDSDDDYANGRPPKRRRADIRATNYDVDLGNTSKLYRSLEILWAAKRITQKSVRIQCPFVEQPVVCSACEPSSNRQTPVDGEPSSVDKRSKLLSRPASPVASQYEAIDHANHKGLDAAKKKRIKLVGRLAAPFAVMKPSHVTLAAPPQWNPKKDVKPSMMVRFGRKEFAVDFCNDMMFVPINTNMKVKLFGRCKDY